MFSSFQGGGKGGGGGWAGQEALTAVSRAERLRGEAAAFFFSLFYNSFLHSPSDTTGRDLREESERYSGSGGNERS